MKEFDQIVWDFNGTIIDDLDCCMECVNIMLEQRGLPTLSSREEYREVFGLPVKMYYARLGFDFSKESYEQVLAPEWTAYYRAKSLDCSLCEDVLFSLNKIKEAGIPQWILSASDQSFMDRQIEALGVGSYFAGIFGLSTIMAESKESLAREWATRHAGQRILFIGDTDHDVAAAKAMGAECMLVSTGHVSQRRLRETGCPVFRTSKDLLESVGLA